MTREKDMDDDIKSRYDAKAAIIKALAHPTRLFIVDELAKGERCVCELRDMVGDDVSTISRHLALLRSVGILYSRRNGTQIIYGLELPCVLGFFKCVGQVMQAKARKQVELAGAKA